MTASAPLAPLTAEQAEPSVAALFAELEATGAGVPPVYRMLAHSPRMLEAWHGFAGPLRGSGDLPVAVKELAILRTAHLTGSDRQWRHHLPLAEAAGVTAAQLDAVRADPDALGPGAALAGAMCGGADPAQAMAAARAELGDAQAVELAMTITYYRCLAGLVAAFGLT
jgi:4-carboxymuconolactone decarboxylase